MKRWFGALIAVMLSCIPILLNRATSSALLRDTDTNVLLVTIRQRNAPLSWFLGDWPLLNHFYRPVSTLAFELDNRLYGTNAAGYGLTNALLCVACVLLLFWFLRELTDKPVIAGACSVLFALQHVGLERWFDGPLFWLAILTGVVGIYRHQYKFWNWLPAVLVLLFAADEIATSGGFGGARLGGYPVERRR